MLVSELWHVPRCSPPEDHVEKLSANFCLSATAPLRSNPAPCSELAIADNQFRPPSNARPLSYRTIKMRLGNILRHLRLVERVTVDATLLESVNRILRNLACKKHYYLTGPLKKAWISDASLTLRSPSLSVRSGHASVLLLWRLAR